MTIDENERAAIKNTRERLAAMSDSGVCRLHRENFESGDFDVDEKRFALLGIFASAASQLRKDRAEFGLSAADMAKMLGYKGSNARIILHEMESGKKAIREPQLRLLVAYKSGYRPADWPKERG